MANNIYIASNEHRVYLWWQYLAVANISERNVALDMLIYLLMVLNVVNGSLNVGTVLFKELDTARTCWTREEIALLNSRRILQDLIPQEVLHAETDEFVPAVLEYFESCAEAVEAVSQGKAQYFMLLALADGFGGWLHVYALPFAKEQFYAGTVKYEQVHSLYQLYNELKMFLKTNGTGWKEPKLTDANNVQPVNVQHVNTITDPCSALIVYEKPKSSDELKSNVNSEDYQVVIPMPILDDKQNPNAIAMPFATNGLRSLTVASSAYILEKYYVASIKCLMSSGSSTEDFSNELYSWIVSEVVPHLQDDKWYPAFGGVLRILKTLRNQGIDKVKSNNKNFKPNDESLLPYHSRHRPMDHLNHDEKEKKASKAGESASTNQLERRIILGLIIALLILTIASACFWCFTALKKPSDAGPPYKTLDERDDQRKTASRLSDMERSRYTESMYETDTSLGSLSSSETEEFVRDPRMSESQPRRSEPLPSGNLGLYERPSVTDLAASGKMSSVLTSDSSMTDEGEISSVGMNTVDITTPMRNLSF